MLNYCASMSFYYAQNKRSRMPWSAEPVTWSSILHSRNSPWRYWEPWLCKESRVQKDHVQYPLIIMKSIPLIIHLHCSCTIRAGCFMPSYMNGGILWGGLVSPSVMMWGITPEFVSWSCALVSDVVSPRVLQRQQAQVWGVWRLAPSWCCLPSSRGKSCVVLLEDFIPGVIQAGVLCLLTQDSCDLIWVSAAFSLSVMEVARTRKNQAWKIN